MPDSSGAQGAPAALELSKALIGRRSVTPEDGGCQPLLSERLARIGFQCETLKVGEVTNLWARRGSARPLVCLAGHTDVVPTGPLAEWHSDPFVPTVRDGRLYGRGAADMKSSLAAFVVATEMFLQENPRHSGSIAFLLTSDEEGPSVDGTVRVVERMKSRGETIDYCIVGEPTSVGELGDMIKNGRRGSLSGRLTVRGVQAHIAYPQLGRNPIHLLAPALAELSAMQWDRGNAHFQPTSWQCSNIHAGTGAGNVIPGSLTLDFNFRYSTESSESSLKQRLEGVLRKHGVDYTLDWLPGGGRPFVTERGRLVEVVSEAIRGQTGRAPELSTTGGTSDARFIAEICREVVEFGPVNASIHKLNEHIELAALEKLPRIYLDVLRALLP
jgi:succinyl-diaminopimelate desuccinylase